MENELDIIKIALEYYDKNITKYDYIYNKIKSIKFEPAKNDLEYNKIYIYDQNNNLLIDSSYEIMGAYYTNTNIWSWGWSMYELNKYYTKIIKKLFDYGVQLNPSNVNNYFLKMELLTSRFKISDPIQLEIYAAIASYLSKIPFVFKYDPKKYSGFIEDVKKYNITNDDENIIYYLFIK